MATNWQIGDKIQNRWETYKILKGGMGIVYVVYDHEFHEAFAAKTFQDDIFARNPQIAARFSQEALVWVNLDIHHNVTQARFVEKVEGKPFLFLEYVSGGDLSGWIGTPRLTEDLPQVLRFAIHFCDGMVHALSKGIRAHRDIKPQNCLITQDNVLKVTDFGLAKAFDDARIADWGTERTGERERRPGGMLGRLLSRRQSKPPAQPTPDMQGLRIGLSRSGTGAGTPPYMAPEQFDEFKHVDVRADIYAFGVMLFEMVTGRWPFVGRTWQELERLHKTQAAPKLATLNAELETVVQICLAKDPARRFADFGSVREQLADIYEGLTGQPAPQPAIGAELDAVQWLNKGGSLHTLGHNEEAFGCLDRALELYPRYADAWAGKGAILEALSRHEEALSCCDHALELNVRLESAWLNKGVALGKLGRNEEELTCCDRALELNPRYEKAWTNKGATLWRLGQCEEAIACYDRALQINPRYAEAWTGKVIALATMGRVHKGRACFEEAQRLGIAMAAEASALCRQMLESAAMSGWEWLDKGVESVKSQRWQEALSCFDRALEINPRLELAWTLKGDTLGALGRDEEVLACYDRAIEINPRTEPAWHNKADALFAIRRDEEAVTCYNQVLALNPRNQKAWSQKAAALMALRRFEEAVACCDRAIELNANDAEAWSNKGTCLGELGRYEEEITCMDCALELNPGLPKAWHNKGVALLMLQRAHDAIRCFEEAVKLGHPKAASGIALCRQMLGK